MRAQMVTGLFQYQPCNLQVDNKVLHVTFTDTGQLLHISFLTEASLTRSQSGLHQLRLTTPQAQYEFLVEDEEAAKDALAALMELTKENSRLELWSVE